MRLLLSILLLAIGARAAVIESDGVDWTSVSNAVAAASAGDTVLIPAGTAAWTSQLTISKAITLRGSGWDDTVITNAIAGNNNILIQLNITTNGITTVENFAIHGIYTNSAIRLDGPLWSLGVIRNMRFLSCWRRAIEWNTCASGLNYSNEFVNCFKGVDVYGDEDLSWQEELSIGTTNVVCIEDNLFLFQGDRSDAYPWSTTAAVSSSGQGGRRLFRNNQIISTVYDLGFAPVLDAHGNQDGVTNNMSIGCGGIRGSRQNEIYANTIVITNGNTRVVRAFDGRGGWVKLRGNHVLTDRSPMTYRLREEDQLGNYHWIGCGTNYYQLTEYPGFDQHWHYDDGSNTLNGTPYPTQYSDYVFEYELDSVFLVEGLNVFVGEGSHEPFPELAYPHPLRSPPVQPAPSIVNATTVNVETLNVGTISFAE
jgi:hypothetical protein